MHGEDGGEGDELFLPARKPMRQPMFEALQPEPPQGFERAVTRLVRPVAQIERPEGHVFEHCGTEKLILGVLEHQPHLAAQGPEILFRPQGLAMKEHSARLRRRQPHDQPEERRLAAPVGTVQPDPLIRVQGKAHVLEDPPPARIGEREALQRKNGFSHGTTPYTSPQP